VYQSPINSVKRSPPAIGSTGRGNRCSRTIVILAAYAPKKSVPKSECASVRESAPCQPSLKMQW